MKTELNKKHYRIISQDRTDLTDYEKDQLIPELKSRLEVLKNYFYDVIRISDDLAGSSLFTQNLHSILNQKFIESQEGNGQSLAHKYFNDAKIFAKVENIDDINRILEKYESIEKVKDLGLFLNEINFLCSSMVNIHNKMFYFNIDAYPHVEDSRTGQAISREPKQYLLTIQPFQITIQNIISVCKATSETVHEWHKYTTRLKTQSLDLYINRLTIRNSRLILFIQITAILLAIGLSAFFLTANDPFNMLKTSRQKEGKIESLNKEVTSLNKENSDLKAQIDKLLNTKNKTDERANNGTKKDGL